MQKDEIRQRARQMESVADLAALLNDIKRDEFHSDRYEITEHQLLYFCNSTIAKNRFKTFFIPKKRGGLREISAPCNQLGILLSMLDIFFKSVYTPSDAAMGFAEGRSIVSNAQVHVGHHYVLNIDLENFFPSIPQARVWKRLQLPPFSFSEKVASVVAGLCCTFDKEQNRNVLPQGSPTSPLLTNAICDRLDKMMTGVAKRFGLHYTRYADDMTFSSMHNVYQEGGEFMTEIRRVVESQGFKMNDKKTRLLRDGQRQEVTGLTVNNRVNVTRKYIRDLRWLLLVWEKQGYAVAYSKFYPWYKHEKGYIKKGEPVMENVVGGKLDYLRMVKGSNNPTYLKLQERYDKLQQIVYPDNQTDKGKSYIYVQPYTVKDFQKAFSTSISLKVSAKHKLVGKCNICGKEKTISISKSTQRQMCPDIEKIEPNDTVASDILKNCFVTLCRNKGKNFWLITKMKPLRSKCLSVQNVNIDVEGLLSIWDSQGLGNAVEAFHQCIDNGKMPNMEARTFINFFTHNKTLSHSQKNRRDKLMARDLWGDREENKVLQKEKSHKFIPLSPLNTAKFFRQFNDPMALKYLTHDFDANDDERPHSMPSLIKQVKEVVGKKEINIPESLWALINGFVSNGKWLDTYGQVHSSTFSDKSWTDWSKTSNMHPICNPDFKSEIMAFRSTVRVVPPMLQEIVDKLKAGTSLNITTEKLSKADFYTNSNILREVIRRILNTMNNRKESYPDVSIAYKRSQDPEGRMLRHIVITQKGSYAIKPLSEIKGRMDRNAEAGDFGAIRKMLNGYCYWSVTSVWDGESYRWNILRNSDVDEVEPIDGNLEGFTHELTFYIV